jgi:DNA polymerase phi
MAEGGAAEVPQHVLELFWQLSSLDQAERASAAASMASALAASPSSPASQYCIKRLVRGLGSGRAGARQGYAAALSTCIRSLGFAAFDSNHLISLIDSEMEEVTVHTKAGDARETFIGRVFGFAAIAHGIAKLYDDGSNPPECGVNSAPLLIDKLLAEGSRRDYLLEPAVDAVLALSRCSSAVRQSILTSSHKLRELILDANSPSDAEQPESLSLALAFAQMPEPTSHSKLIPSPEAHALEWSKLFPTLERASRTQPRLHSVWSLLMSHLSRGSSNSNAEGSKQPHSIPTSRASALWTGLVEHGLLESSRDRRGVALELGRMLARKLEPNGAAELATPNLVSTIVDHLSKAGRLRIQSERCLYAMLANCDKHSSTILSRFRGIAGEGKFEAMRRAASSKTRTLMQSLDQWESGMSANGDCAPAQSQLSGIAKSVESIDWLNDTDNAAQLVEEAGRAWRESKLSLDDRTRLARKLAEVGMFDNKASEYVRVKCSNKMLFVLGNSGAGIDRDVDVKSDGSREGRMREAAHRNEAVLDAVYAECRMREKSEVPAKRAEMGEKGIELRKAARKAITKQKKICKSNVDDDTRQPAQRLDELNRLARMVSILHLGWPSEYSAEIEAVPELLHGPARDGGSSAISVILGLMGKGRWVARSAAERAFRSIASDLKDDAIKEVTNALLAPAEEIFPDSAMEGEDTGNGREDDDNDEGQEENADIRSEAKEDKKEPITGLSDLREEEPSAQGMHADSNGNAGTPHKEDESEELPDLGDDDMFKLDEAISQALRDRKRSRSERAQKAAEFRFRIVGLVDALARESPSSPVLPLLVPRLLQGVKKPASTDWPQALTERVHALLKKRISRLPSAPKESFQVNKVVEAARDAFESAVRASTEIASSSSQAAAHYLARILANTGTSAQRDVVVELYANALSESCRNKKSKLTSSFFSSAVERLPFLGPRLVPTIADEAAEIQALAVGRSRRDHVTVELAKLLPAMLRKRDEESRSALRSACERLASALPGILRATAHLKARKRAELCRALAEACELAEKREGVGAISRRADATAIDDATSPLIEEGSQKKLSSAASRIRQAAGLEPGASAEAAEVGRTSKRKRSKKDEKDTVQRRSKSATKPNGRESSTTGGGSRASTASASTNRGGT